jgi:hypothetical protein
MQRITRLLSPMPPRPVRHALWLAVPGTLGIATVLLASTPGRAMTTSTVATTATATAAGSLPSLSDVLSEVLVLRGDRDGHPVRYERRVERTGVRTERLFVDGHAVTIDAGARRWIAAATTVPPLPAPPHDLPAPPASPRLADLPAPPMPPNSGDIPAAPASPNPGELPAPPAPPRPDDIPAPPAPPSMVDSEAYHAAVAAIQADQQVRAALGGPVAVAGLAGPSRISGAHADLTLAVSGTQGTKVVRATRSIQDGAWHIDAAAIAKPAAR